MMIQPVSPAYELDSVTDDQLEALILQLGLKRHNKNSLDPCCVICRQDLILKNHFPTLQPFNQIPPSNYLGYVPNRWRDFRNFTLWRSRIVAPNHKLYRVSVSAKFKCKYININPDLINFCCLFVQIFEGFKTKAFLNLPLRLFH